MRRSSLLVLAERCPLHRRHPTRRRRAVLPGHSYGAAAVAAGDAMRRASSGLLGQIFGSGGKSPDEDVAAGASEELAKVLQAVIKGRMDLALKHARPLAEERGLEPSGYIAQECSERAFSAFIAGESNRQRAVELSVHAASFNIPGRGEYRPRALKEGFWLREVSTQHVQLDVLCRLCRAAIALRGLELPDKAEELDRRVGAGEKVAQEEAAFAARDLEVLGQCVPIRLQTSQCKAVLHTYIAKEFGKDATGMVRHQALFTLLLKAGRHFKEEFSAPAPNGASGQLVAESTGEVIPPSCVAMKAWSDRRQAAAQEQLKILAEVTSEAAVRLFTDTEDALQLLEVARHFYEIECPLALRRDALGIFRATAEKLQGS